MCAILRTRSYNRAKGTLHSHDRPVVYMGCISTNKMSAPGILQCPLYPYTQS